MDQYLDEITYKFQKKIVKAWLLEGHRVDGRAKNEIRPAGRRGGRAAPRPRLGPVHPRPDPGALRLHPGHPLRQPEAGHHLGGDGEALHAPLQLPRLLRGRGQARPQPRPPRDRPRRAGRARPAACAALRSRSSPMPSAWSPRWSQLQRLHLPGLHLRLHPGADGRRRAHQGPGGRHLLRPDPGRRRLLHHLHRHSGRGGLPRRDGLQGRPAPRRASPPSRWT